ncbi:hypothetical protein BDZ97DRAFT_1919431 [Flammula alnicola]|nr:hypothetical protein BDZ97DRAFT_1919431 [Flammula alnicola]
MSRWAQEAASTVYAAFRLCFGRDDPCFITRLPADIFVDEIFPQLLVEELLRLRQTNKAFYLLTHEPTIWRRYMRRLHGIPLSQLRPTFQFNHPMANHEIEHLVTTACALERSWRSGFPNIRSVRILLTQYKVVDLKLVPGGKFLVASVKDRSNFRFFIMVYALDVMYGCRLLARLPTFFKVYDLQAKYLEHDGRPGIMISYTRRRFKYGPPQDVDISDYSHKHPIDTVYPLAYEACCVHMRLDSIEPLIRVGLKPQHRGEYMAAAREMESPFRDVLRYETDMEIHAPTLFETAGVPCIGFIEGPGKIQFIQLTDRQKATLQFTDFPGYVGMPHRIRAFRYLPCQHGLFVIRSISTAPGTAVIAFEFYDFPDAPGPHVFDALHGWECADTWNIDDEFVITDPEVPHKKMGPDHPDILPKEECPPTLWVFAPSKEPKGSAYWWFRPVQVQKQRDTEETRYHYMEVPARAQFHHNRYHHERALPGSERTLLLEIDKGITEATPLNKMRRFLWPAERFPQRYPTRQICEPITEVGEECVLAFTDVGTSQVVGDEVNSEGGLAAITWDENSGKVCLAAENGDQIRVCDLAPVVEPHRRLAYKWRQQLINPEAMHTKHQNINLA